MKKQIIIFLCIKFSPDNRRKENISYAYDYGYITVNRSYILNKDYISTLEYLADKKEKLDQYIKISNILSVIEG